jgi:hypothetical protein
MPLGNNLEDAGTEKDGTKSSKYCKYCYVDGELQYKGNDLKEFKTVAYKHMRDRGVNYFMANLYTYMINFAPRWKK